MRRIPSNKMAYLSKVAFGICVHLRRPCPSIKRGSVTVHEPLPFAVGQEELPPEQRSSRAALLSEARWACRQGRAKRPVIGNPAKMNLTNCKSD